MVDARTPHDAPPLCQQPMRVEVLSQERLLDAFFKVDRARIRYERFDGSMSAPVERLVFERGDSVAVLLYDAEHDEVILVQQFRYPAHVREGRGWLWEVIAGMQEPGLGPEEVARREALEEAGYCVGELTPIATVYPSPGASSERIVIYMGRITTDQRIAAGGGLSDSGEDTRVGIFSWDAVADMLQKGLIVDAKTVLALQYLASHRRHA
jgi:ADP-ribose pyrophosphatase